MSADVILKTTTVLKEMKIAQLERTLVRSPQRLSKGISHNSSISFRYNFNWHGLIFWITLYDKKTGWFLGKLEKLRRNVSIMVFEKKNHTFKQNLYSDT